MPIHTHDCAFYPDPPYQIENSLESLYGYLFYLGWKYANSPKPISYKGHWERTFLCPVTGGVLTLCDAAQRACSQAPTCHSCCGGIGGHWACC